MVGESGRGGWKARATNVTCAASRIVRAQTNLFEYGECGGIKLYKLYNEFRRG